MSFKTGQDDSCLDFKFIRNALFANEGHEEWETEFLKQRLVADGYITFKDFNNISLPNITANGIDFIQKGGYKYQIKQKLIEDELQLRNLKNAKRSWISIILSRMAILINR